MSIPHAYDALSAKNRKVLERLPHRARHAIAEAASHSGINSRSPAYTWLLEEIRHQLRLGDRPGPAPGHIAEVEYLLDRVPGTVAEARELAGLTDEPKPTGRITANPDGYTDPDTVLPPNVLPFRHPRH